MTRSPTSRRRGARGVLQLDDEGALQDIVEFKRIEREDNHAVNRDSEGRQMKLTGNEIVSMNMWGFTPAHIRATCAKASREVPELHGADLNAECYLPSTVNDLIHEGKAHVKVLRSGDSWFGVTYREDREHAVESIRRLVESGAYPERLWS